MNIVSQAKQNIRLRRENAEAASQNAQEELYKFDDYDKKDYEIRQQVLAVAKAHGTTAEKKERTKLKKLRAEQNEIIKNHGFSRDNVEVNYNCKLCLDTGKVNGKYCKCLKEEIRRLTFSQCEISNSEFTFESSADHSKPYELMKEWCEKYPDVKFTNALLVGKSGVGKTYLSSCIANALIEKEVELLFITAYSLNQKFLQVHLADFDEKQDIAESYQDVDVLIIDDLGTEPILKNVTEESFFALFNERRAKGKCTIVSTNLTLDDILKRYNERTFSRLTDQKGIVIALTGEDRRHKSK